MKDLIRGTLLTSLVIASAAHAEVVVVTHPKHPAAAMSAEQIANVYLGKDGSFAPVDLPESSSVRGEFYQKVASKDAAQVKAIWARLIFTGKTQPPKEVDDFAAAVKFVASNEKAIAYVDKSAVDASVKVVLELK